MNANLVRQLQDSVLAVWFEGWVPGQAVSGNLMKKWFGKDEAFDNRLRTVVPDTIQRGFWKTHTRYFEHWKSHIGFHQNSKPDPQARIVARHAFENGYEDKLHPVHRAWLYMPLEHSEDKVDQALSVMKFQQLAEESSDTYKELFESFSKYAQDHKAVIDRFGRYPHRNKILDRKSTLEEEEFMKDHNGW
ncbi:hypothetical protein INT44_008470 [Umbelopsis vinacea]|uniref:Uncharacterized protein n=1 Tax=Umbelopsis vinacea TaxID=44442 RepID=A0A8H7UG04_9FUNG|nr:hypothetical protein INT44_008470 [Umbelopsis vinacea]